MPLSPRDRRALRFVAATVVFAALALRYVQVRVLERASHMWLSASADEARANGSLVHAPLVAESTLAWRRVEYRVQDLFVEQVTHVEYPLFLYRRVVKDPEYRLVLSLSKGPHGVYFPEREARVTYGDSGTFPNSSSSPRGPLYFANVKPPFPDTIRLRVEPAR